MSRSAKIATELSVNGESHEVLLSAQATLVEVLRDQLRLTGTKRGCNQGVCGACTVLIDGIAARSCLTLAAGLDGSAVTTIEGLREDAVGGGIMQALVEGGAVQCGFCTPGMVIALMQLFRDKPRPSAIEIREAVSGNLCRCTGYRKVIDAAVSLACRNEVSHGA